VGPSLEEDRCPLLGNGHTAPFMLIAGFRISVTGDNRSACRAVDRLTNKIIAPDPLGRTRRLLTRPRVISAAKTAGSSAALWLLPWVRIPDCASRHQIPFDGMRVSKYRGASNLYARGTMPIPLSTLPREQMAVAFL
jgi:hypothetical protein